MSNPSNATMAGLAASIVILAIPAMLILIIPFICHWRHKSVPACALIFWITLANFLGLLNALIWPNANYDSWWEGYVLCDIEAKLVWPISMGVFSSLLCLTRNLSMILDVENCEMNTTTARRRRKIAFDTAVCFTVPIVEIALHYIFQPNRYFIEPVAGCLESVDYSWPFIIVYLIWQPILVTINFYFTSLVLYRIRLHRRAFNSVLESSGSGVSKARFLRLFIMSVTILFIYTPWVAWDFSQNIQAPFHAFSWAFVHNPAVWDIIIYLNFDVEVYGRFLYILFALLVFLFVGMGNDAMDMYRRFMVKCGLARIWPSLLEPRRRRSDATFGGTGTSRVGLISKAKSFFSSSSSSGRSHRGSIWSNGRKTSLAPTATTLSPTATGFNAQEAQHLGFQPWPSSTPTAPSAVYTGPSSGFGTTTTAVHTATPHPSESLSLPGTIPPTSISASTSRTTTSHLPHTTFFGFVPWTFALKTPKWLKLGSGNGNDAGVERGVMSARVMGRKTAREAAYLGLDAHAFDLEMQQPGHGVGRARAGTRDVGVQATAEPMDLGEFRCVSGHFRSISPMSVAGGLTSTASSASSERKNSAINVSEEVTITSVSPVAAKCPFPIGTREARMWHGEVERAFVDKVKSRESEVQGGLVGMVPL